MICEHCRKQFLLYTKGEQYDISPSLGSKDGDELCVWLCDSCSEKLITMSEDMIEHFLKIKKGEKR